jgi:hypothetical protein
MGKFLVFTNAADGRDDDYNQWYDEVHAVEMCALQEYTGVTRYKLTDAQMVPDQSHRYVAIYEFEGSAEDAVAALKAALPTFTMTDAVKPDAKMIYLEETQGGTP